MSEVVISSENRGITITEMWEKHSGMIIASASLLMIGLGWITERNGLGGWSIICFVLAYVVGGYRKAWEGLETLIKERDLDVDLLMVVAAIGAASIGYWMDGAVLIFIFCLSGALEDYSMEKTNQDIAAILKYRPEEAMRLSGDTETKVKASELHLGDVVVVRPGERIPCDGMILAGISAVDQASITGESIPVDKATNDPVFAGTMNGQGALQIKVTKAANDTLLSRIIHMVQEAKNELPPSQLFIERFEGIYAKSVVGLAVMLMILPPFLFGWTWKETIYRAMIFLVVASPCALVSSIMPAMLSGISNAARKGVLFKGGVHLEQIGNVNAVAFDKTGTLTEGKPKVTDIFPVEGNSEEDLLRLAASLEHLSEHPIAKAIVEAAHKQNLILEQAATMQAVTGMGVSGTVNGKECRIGKRGLLLGLVLDADKLNKAQQLESEGKTVVFVESEDQFAGMIAVQDILRTHAVEAIQQLKKMGKHVVMLTGDAKLTAEAIGRAAGVDEIFAELMPDEKLQMIKNMTKTYGKVAMVGDGVNDAPALAAASVGIAMGAAGTDVALETANVVLMTDDILKIPYAISLGIRTSRVMKQNITFALAVILVLVSSNFWGGLNLPSGVVSHEGSTLLVILSGLRLLR
ncbi:cadmium-translocating P-type ATPase [Paenibacillus sp. 19GGS1-52]|uniref:heavy metal translocating P-type ATPase n=1 Tax=Paenibacillus sp. 19GGS1-52 TaxID=2758563 RepID=UPI001EFB5803|nr:heavy metal translocating P-type ATPase [Paenibacillus sp. 19GGS1-52]ULO04705.1 cadmium-translocating P-type ATPase [Paenibacillus sp. 19GGS1-52]